MIRNFTAAHLVIGVTMAIVGIWSEGAIAQSGSVQVSGFQPYNIVANAMSPAASQARRVTDRTPQDADLINLVKSNPKLYPTIRASHLSIIDSSFNFDVANRMIVFCWGQDAFLHQKFNYEMIVGPIHERSAEAG